MEAQRKENKFCLCVDVFGVEYHNETDDQDVLRMLGKHYKYIVDWTGRHFYELTLDWDYDAGYVNVSMPT